MAFTALSSLYKGFEDSIIKFTQSYLRFCSTEIRILLIEILSVTEGCPTSFTLRDKVVLYIYIYFKT